MRPLIHPAIKDVSLETILHALSDPVRVTIYAHIVGQKCSRSCSTYLHTNNKPIPKSTLSQHFKILREAGLIRGERRGVEMHNISRCMEVDEHYPALIATILKAHYIHLAAKTKRVKDAGEKRKA